MEELSATLGLQLLPSPPHPTSCWPFFFVIVGIFIGRICVTRTIAIYSSVSLPWNAGMSAAASKSLFNFSRLVLKMIVLFLSPAVQRVHDNKTADFSISIETNRRAGKQELELLFPDKLLRKKSKAEAFPLCRTRLNHPNDSTKHLQKQHFISFLFLLVCCSCGELPLYHQKDGTPTFLLFIIFSVFLFIFFFAFLFDGGYISPLLGCLFHIQKKEKKSIEVYR